MVDPKKIGKLIRIWTTDSIYRSAPRTRLLKKKVAVLLSKVPGQKFPNIGFRLLEIDVSRLKHWTDLVRMLDDSYPESFSGSLTGLKNYERNASGGHVDIGKAGFLAFQIEMKSSDWLFSLRSLYAQLPREEREIEDDAGFTIKEYLEQDEVVARPGTLRRSLREGRASLIGAAAPHSKMTWYATPKRIRKM
jgi:hypothetical protein